MDKCREDFEKYVRDKSGFTADFQIGCNGQYKSDLMHFMFVTYQHQQAKVEELQKRIDTALEKIDRFYKDGCLFHEWVYVAEQALKGECKHESDGSHLLSNPPKTKCKKCGEFYSVYELKEGDQ